MSTVIIISLYILKWDYLCPCKCESQWICLTTY